MEAIYDDIVKPLGFQGFAASLVARGPMFSSRQRLNLQGEELKQPEGSSELDIY
jgi:hypothetical protein